MTMATTKTTDVNSIRFVLRIRRRRRRRRLSADRLTNVFSSDHSGPLFSIPWNPFGRTSAQKVSGASAFFAFFLLFRRRLALPLR